MKVVKTLKTLLKRVNFPKHSSKYSNKIFDNHQHIIIQVFKQKMKLPYRDLVHFLEASKIPAWLGLKRIPHFTSPNKFLVRFSPKFIEWLIARCSSILNLDNVFAGIDSTGFSLIKGSHHYYKRIKRKFRKKDFIKYSGIADLNNGLILATRIRKKRRHDTKDFKPLLRRARRQAKIKAIVGDKGYDNEKNHEFAREKIGAESIIPLRHEDVPIWRTRGKYRKQLKRKFPKKKYNKRVRKESVISVLKRKYGSVLQSVKFKSQKNEVLFKVLGYNIDVINKVRDIFCQFFKGFLQTLIILKQQIYFDAR